MVSFLCLYFSCVNSDNLKRVISINIYLVPRRITRNFRMKQVEVDDEEDDEEDEEDNTNADEKVDQKEEQTTVSSQSNDSKQEEKKNITETNDNRPRTRRAVAEASDKSNDHVNEQGDDLYTRIKHSRRKIQTKPNSKYNFYFNH